MAALLSGCAQSHWTGHHWEVNAKLDTTSTDASTLLNFGDSCKHLDGPDALTEGLCCCKGSGRVAYGAKGGKKLECKDADACGGARKGFCAMKPEKGVLPFFAQATTDFCQFDCPCCKKRDFSQDFAMSLLSLSDLVAGNTTAHHPLYNKWEQDPVELLAFDVSNDTFHRDVMANVKANYTLEEFYNATFEYPTWASLESVKQQKGWDDEELAMYLYTTETPHVYGIMNKLMRQATSMKDISAHWQSYMVYLKRGLQTRAAYAKVDTYRGVGCDATDDLEKGDWGVLPSFTSTSAARHVGYNWGCTLIHLTGGGYDISKYSQFPGEQELLVEPGRLYEVVAKEKDEKGKTTVQLQTKGPGSMRVPPRKSDVGSRLESIESHESAMDQDQCSDFDMNSCAICTCCEQPPSAGAFLAMPSSKRSRKAKIHTRKDNVVG